ncbi:hypothetical protein E2562_003688 [Oryza meyeriana var. granulata]|uniref:KIB1-4 beta-propeller domain-containing protein n=1 Tax=Oryza meyeriana var. granulata TaxID=110450 RepID=A0A6G1C4Q8_9ORYZ|nr:hypothetical protein E2562_003688 [Oryza meyeriana var. granulata]
MEISRGGAAAVVADWMRLPEDMLVTVFCQLEIPDLLRSGAVCAAGDSPVRVPARELRDCMYFRAVLSCSPHAGAACVVQPGASSPTPGAATSGGRGSRRTTALACTLQWRNWYCDAAYNKNDGLLYVVRDDDAVHTLDLTGRSPVARKVFNERRWTTNLPSMYLAHVHVPCGKPYRYLAHGPWGELLHVRRFRYI